MPRDAAKCWICLKAYDIYKSPIVTKHSTTACIYLTLFQMRQVTPVSPELRTRIKLRNKKIGQASNDIENTRIKDNRLLPGVMATTGDNTGR